MVSLGSVQLLVFMLLLCLTNAGTVSQEGDVPTVEPAAAAATDSVSDPVVEAAKATDSVPVSDAYSKIAPFINEKTPVVVRLNLAQFDFDKLSDSLKAYFRADLKRIGFDEDSQRRTEAEFAKTLDELVNLGSVYFEDFRASSRISDVFVVFVLNDDSADVFCVVPAKGLGESEREYLEGLLKPFNFSVAEVGESFVVATEKRKADETAEYWQAFVAAKNEKLESALSKSFDATLSVYITPFPLEETLSKNGVEFDEFFDAAKKQNILLKPFWNLVKRSFEQATATFDLNSLTSGLSIEFSDEKSASGVRKQLEMLIDQGTSVAMQTLAAETARDRDVRWLASFNLFPLTREYLRGTARLLLLPQQEGNCLIVRPGGRNGAGLAIGGVAVGLLLPAVQAARESARRMQCTNNMKQIALAMHMYNDVHGSIPPIYSVDSDGKPLHSWRVLLLPFLERTALYDQIRLDEPWDSEWNSQFHSQMPDVYSCPDNEDARQRLGLTHYSVVAGEETAFKPNNGKGFSLAYITDGTSNTIFLVERKKGVCWMDPNQEFAFESLENGFDPDADDSLFSFHPDGSNVSMFDGSVRYMRKATPIEILKAMATAKGGESGSSF